MTHVWHKKKKIMWAVLFYCHFYIPHLLNYNRQNFTLVRPLASFQECDCTYAHWGSDPIGVGNNTNCNTEAIQI